MRIVRCAVPAQAMTLPAAGVVELGPDAPPPHADRVTSDRASTGERFFIGVLLAETPDQRLLHRKRVFSG